MRRTPTPTADELLDAIAGPARSSLAEFRAGRGGRRASAWWRYATAKGSDPMAQLDLEEQRALSKASGAVGAFLVPTDLSDAILSVARARGAIAALASQYLTADGTTFSVPIGSVHGSASWLAEAGTYAATDETLATVSFGANKATTSIVVSEELAADATFDFDRYLSEELGGRVAALEAAAFAVGSGTGQPAGAVAGVGTTITMPVGNTTTFAYDSLVDALHTVAPGYREPDQNPAWVGSDAALKALRKVKDTAGAPILFERDGPPRLFGFEFRVDENFASPAANATPLLFASWRNFYGVRRVNAVSVTRQAELFSNQGNIGFRAMHRVDGRVLIAAAGVGVKCSAT